MGLASHLAKTGAEVEALVLPWLLTLFAGFQPMPRMTLCRVWECWLLDGSPKVFFRIVLALLARAEETLLNTPPEQMSEVLRTFPAPLDDALVPSRLVPRAWAVKVTRKQLRHALEVAKIATAVEAAGAVAARDSDVEGDAVGVASARIQPLLL